MPERRVRTSRPRLSRECGQATVEFVALLPVLALVSLALLQAVLAGHAWWSVGAAARAAARAAAVGADPRAGARAVLPRRLEHGLAVRELDDGAVRIVLRIPSVVGPVDLGTVRATARHEPQDA